LAIIVGNESYGISKEVLGMADLIVEMPMWGINTSLNVMVSSGIILYEIMKQHHP
jgi:tRNA G18 (ribose-2'-O)-methylase SpoU